MRNAPRRRRSDDDYGRGGLPLFPLVLVVILAGLLLGGGLAHFFGGAGRGSNGRATDIAIVPTPVPTLGPVSIASPAPTVTPMTSTPTPTTTPAPAVAAASPSPTGAPPTLTPAPSPAVQATSQKPTVAHVIAEPAHAVAALTHVAAARSPVTAAPAQATAAPAQATAAPARVQPPPTATAVAETPDDNASSLVRSYLDALAHGDRSTAAAYLTHGLPNETFMSQGARIESIRSASVGPQQYHVTADVFTASGEYYDTFTVEAGPSGLAIADHYWIKP
jgi:hypothetical protein